jgi:hypothetical protein
MTTYKYPVPNRSRFVPNRIKTDDNPTLDVGWDQGAFSDGRPYRVECWAEDGMTCITILFSNLGLEGFTKADFCRFFVTEGLLHFRDPQRAYVNGVPFQDDDGHPIWSVTVVIGLEDELLVDDRVRLKPYPSIA